MIRRADAHVYAMGSVVALPALLVAPLGSLAAEASGDWHYGVTLYLWGAGIQGETASGAEVDVGFDTLISNLDMAFMGAFEARRDRWSVGADLVYLDVRANESGEVPVRLASGATGNVNVAAGVATTGWVFNLSGVFNLVHTERANLDLILGARYLDLALDFDLDLAAAQYTVTPGIVATQVTWDGVVGVKGRVLLDEPWYLSYYFDVGAGESDLTWQVAGGLGYAFDWGDVTLPGFAGDGDRGRGEGRRGE